MDPELIKLAIGGLVLLGCIGLFFGIGLALAAHKFAVESNPLIEEVLESLPLANCGGCGYPGCEGYAIEVVTDPDVFAAGDVYELLTRDMGEAAVMGRHRSGKSEKEYQVATSVMLLDCARLQHWDAEKEFGQLFSREKDYKEWMVLAYEDPANIGYIEDCWNDFDNLDTNTRLLHNTKRKTQPWKTGLPVDYTPANKFKDKPLLASANRMRAKLFGEYGLLGRYQEHPDKRQEQFFFGLLKECLECGHISEELVRQEISKNHVRHDAFEVLDRTPKLEVKAA